MAQAVEVIEGLVDAVVVVAGDGFGGAFAAEVGQYQRVTLPGVSPSRAGQLLAGALVAEAAMEVLGIEELDVCPWALREGVILRRLDWLAEQYS